MADTYWPTSVRRALSGLAFKADTGPQLQQIGAMESELSMQAAGWQPMPEMAQPEAPQAPAPLPAVELPSLDEMTKKWAPQPVVAQSQSAGQQPPAAGTGQTGSGMTAAPSFGPASGPPGEGVLRWREPVMAASATYGVPPEVIMGIMDIESGGNPDAVSPQGAMSLMQVMPFHYGAGENGMDPLVSIDRGAKILADNYRRYGDWDKAAAAYFGAIDANGNITDASDATGTTGNRYVTLFRGAASKYADQRQSSLNAAPPGGAPQPAAGGSSAPAAGLPPSVAQAWQTRTGGAQMTAEDLQQLRMLGVVA